MNWANIDRILSACTRRPGLADVPKDLAVGDYAELLSRYNGVEGFVGADQYLVLWSADQIRELNSAYRVSYFAPNITLLGTNGADTGYGREKQTGRYVAVPLVGLSNNTATDSGESLEEFLTKLAMSA